jgi:endonuclease/exonuclease/phosphatase family metal-dependent hydrolase
MKRYILSTSVFIIIAAAACMAQSFDHPPAIDGRFDDWDARPALLHDPAGDGGPSGVDFRTLRVESDREWIYISFDTEAEHLIQSDNPLTLYIDTDVSSTTGTQFGGIGAELIWRFGRRTGQVHLGTSTTTVRHADIGYIPAPSMTSSRFEFALRRDAVINGRKLFSNGSIRLFLHADEDGGDRMPDGDGGVTVRLQDVAAPRLTERTLEATAPGSVRIVGWNVEQNGLLDPARRPIFERMLRAMRPDVMCFQECFELSAGQVQTMIAETMSPPEGRHWRALKTGNGNVMVTHLDIEGDWLVQQGYRQAAYYLRTPGGKPLLVINAHLRCCGADDKRREEVDGVIAFVRDARTPGDRIDVEHGTPILMVGDFNLVGDRAQLHTLLTGDIMDNATYGPGFAPDWDGGHWTELPPVHPTSLFTWTWYDTKSTFSPGKLDYVLYTASVMDVTQHLVMNTRDMSDAQLNRHGLHRDDAIEASDHMARVVDVAWKQTSGRGALDAPAAPDIGELYPQPARDVLHVGVHGRAGAGASLALRDILGRTLLQSSFVHEQDGQSGQVLTLDGLPAGTYMLTVIGTQGMTGRRVLLY